MKYWLILLSIGYIKTHAINITEKTKYCTKPIESMSDKLMKRK